MKLWSQGIEVPFNASMTYLRLLLLILCGTCAVAHADSHKYFRIGNQEDIQTKPRFGIAMMGGGSDLDEAFRWLCKQGNGGDFLILRASGDDDYNPYMNGLCKANSVATLIIPDRTAAENPIVAETAGDKNHWGSGELHSRMEGNCS
jgi:cyanophycinase